MPKLSIEIKPDKFNDFLHKLEDLAKISDVIKLKIDSDNILMYSIVGDTILLAFKNYLINTSDYLIIKEELKTTLDIIITNAKKYVKNLSFIKLNDKINLAIDYRENDENIYSTRFLNIKNGKFKIGLQGGEDSEIRDIPKDILEKRIDLKNKKWSFKIKSEDFQDIKKLSSINSEGKILNLSIEKGKVILSDHPIWEIQVDEIDSIDRELIFNKSFLSSIDDNLEYIELHIFETFILTKTDISNLMISFEQSFDGHDD
jgi:hypothetical protein